MHISRNVRRASILLILLAALFRTILLEGAETEQTIDPSYKIGFVAGFIEGQYDGWVKGRNQQWIGKFQDRSADIEAWFERCNTIKCLVDQSTRFHKIHDAP